MDFNARLENGEELEFLTTLPAELLHYQVFPIVFVATGKWGAIIFQGMLTEDFVVWYSNFLIKESCCIIIEAALETRELHVAYKNDFNVDSDGLRNVRIKEGQFNVTYLPRVNTTLRFAPGEYGSFDINYAKDYLQRFIPHLSGLEEFLHNTEKGISCHLSPTHSYATHEMIAVIKSILDYEYTDGLGLIYIESQALALLVLAVKTISKEKEKSFILTPADRARMETVRSWLVANVGNPGSLRTIAQQFAINEYRLKRDFKQVYGTTVFEYLGTIRMEMAKKMLLETSMPISEIAYLAGYSSGAHFADAFRRHFNYSPIYLRKK